MLHQAAALTAARAPVHHRPAGSALRALSRHRIMFDLQRMFHVGIAVADLSEAMQRMGADLHLEWSPVRRFDPLPFWTPERGCHEVSVSAVYSRQGPQHLELVQSTGAFYAPGAQPDNRHIGVWVDDLPAEAHRLLRSGWCVWV